MIQRTPTGLMVQAALTRLDAARGELARATDRAGSQRAITLPSDDPSGTAQAMRIRAAVAANQQHARNIADANGWLATVDNALAATTDILHRVRDLTLQGANEGSMSATAREALAVELEGLATDLLAQANTRFLGRSVFAGTSDAAAAFDASFTSAGTGAAVERRIAEGTTVRVDADGTTVFGDGATSVFALVHTIAADLRAGVSVQPHLSALDGWREGVLAQQAATGAQQTQVMRAEELNMADAVTLETERSGVEDVDLAEAIMQLELQRTTYQAALAVTSRVLQPTLMDYLR